RGSTEMLEFDGPLRQPRNSKDLEFFTLLDRVVALKIQADSASGEELFDDDLIEYADYPQGKEAFLAELLNLARYSFPLITEKCEAERLDRRASMLAGPFYTNHEYPWPGTPGGVYEPLVQIDLAWAGDVGGVNLGTGLMQVWSARTETFFRVLSAVSVAAHQPEPIPKWAAILDQGADLSRWFTWDTRESDVGCWVTHGHRAVGVEEKVPDIHQAVVRFLESEVIDRADEYDSALVEAARQALKIENSLSSTSRRATSVSGSLFGNVHPWNWDATLDRVLLNLQSDNVFCFAGEGQGTIYYHLDPCQEPQFWFDWGL